MIGSDVVAEKMAALLLQIHAVKLNPVQPYTWSSGWKSPIYCDNRLTLSFPEIRTYIKESFVRLLKEKFPATELIAGVATAGIAHGALLADALETPFCYVRSSAKTHGLGNKIEGLAMAGQKVVVVEDLLSTGGSSLAAVDALRNAGCAVIGLVAIFTYGFPVATAKFEAAGCPFFTLTDYETLLQAALNNGTITGADLKNLDAWRVSPSTWGQNS